MMCTNLFVPGHICEYFSMLTGTIDAFLFVILFSILDLRKDKQVRTS
jgi:hypothetical protein